MYTAYTEKYWCRDLCKGEDFFSDINSIATFFYSFIKILMHKPEIWIFAEMAKRNFFTPASVSQLSARLIAILAYPKDLIVHNAPKGRLYPLSF